jgi:hypothetical protein
MKQPISRVAAFVLLFPLISPLCTVHAQTATALSTLAPFSYDAAKEVVLEGNVAAILTNPAPGMIPGSHLLLTNPSGSVDVSLGIFGLRGSGALTVKVGQEVSVTGIVTTVKGKQVFLARTVKVSEKVYAIRNVHGILLPPQARERVNHSKAWQEEAR